MHWPPEMGLGYTPAGPLDDDPEPPSGCAALLLVALFLAILGVGLWLGPG